MAPSERASTVHPGLFLHGPELKSGEDGLTVGLAAAAAALVVEKERTAVRASLVIIIKRVNYSQELMLWTACAVTQLSPRLDTRPWPVP